jgi:hypothetical protein
MCRRPDQCRDEMLQGRYEAVGVSPGSLQKRAEPLQGPRNDQAKSEDFVTLDLSDCCGSRTYD